MRDRGRRALPPRLTRADAARRLEQLEQRRLAARHRREHRLQHVQLPRLPYEEEEALGWATRREADGPSAANSEQCVPSTRTPRPGSNPEPGT